VKYHNSLSVTCRALTFGDTSQNFGVHIAANFSVAFLRDNSSSFLYLSSRSFFLSSSCFFSASILACVNFSCSFLSKYSLYVTFNDDLVIGQNNQAQASASVFTIHFDI
jgi:hypothetical protein